MTYQKYYSVKRGMIVVDIALALALATFFIAVITETSFGARNLFNVARERERLLDVYEAHAGQFDGMRPYESRTVVSENGEEVTGTARRYGNDRIQVTVDIRRDAHAVQPLRFIRIETDESARHSYSGTPLCSAEFTHPREVAGSYPFLARMDMQPPPPMAIGVSLSALPIYISPTLPLTDLEVRGTRIYVSADSPLSVDPDLLMFDTATSTAFSTSVHTGPGLASIALSGPWIFAAAASTAAQLHVIRADMAGGLETTTRYRLPLPYATATPPFASSIFYKDDKIYLGTEKWDGEEFMVINVADPLSPQVLGGYETGSKVNDILVIGRTAFVTAADEKQLRVLDISDPANIPLAHSFAPTGWQRQEGRSLSFFEDGLFLGRTSGGFNIVTDHELFSWATSSSVFPATLSEFVSRDHGGGIYGIVPDRSYTFILTKEAGREFQIFDRFLSTSTMVSYRLPARPQVLTCDGSSLYILAAPNVYKVDLIQ